VGYRPAAALVLALLAPAVLAAAPLYKLVDRNGRVTFTDTPPKSFDGQVIRLEPATTPTIAPPPMPRASQPSGPVGAASEGFGERRQREQAELLARLEKARRSLDEARAAKEAGGLAKPDEMQVIQRRYPPLRPGQAAPFPNCVQRTDPGSGANVLICPTQVPGLAYDQRQRKLEDALAEAEAALAEAERAYRRGMD
jgi:ribosomal protein L29